jgi:2-polyprenyl-6-methoxyphenol hydroxylase-like FAD-dependent oxidoreductase
MGGGPGPTRVLIVGGGFAGIACAGEFYVRPRHRTAELLDPSTLDTPRIKWNRRNR